MKTTLNQPEPIQPCKVNLPCLMKYIGNCNTTLIVLFTAKDFGMVMHEEDTGRTLWERDNFNIDLFKPLEGSITVEN
jgi:hypothetical protein